MENDQVPDAGPLPTPAPARATLSRARRSVIDLIQAQGSPILLSTLVELSGLHENTLRGHLEELEKAGLVTREKASARGRGRPAWLWRIMPPEAAEYAGLATALARTLRRTSAHPLHDAIEAGQAWGEELAATRSLPTGSLQTPTGQLQALLECLGFAPQGSVDARTDSADFRLTRCPLLNVAREEPEITCHVHQGLVAGALQHYGALDPEARLLPFSEPGACRLRVSHHARDKQSTIS